MQTSSEGRASVASRPHRRDRGRGFALPVVLLLLAALSALALRMVEQSQDGIDAARARLGEAAARGAADAGYEMFLTRYAAIRDASGLPEIDTRFGSAALSVRGEAESGKVDLNIGMPGLIEGILRIAGADTARARGIAEAVAAFRGQGGIFHTVDGLLRLPGMDLALLERVRPHVTVYSAAPGIDPRTAPREVLMAVPGMTGGAADRIVAARSGEAELDREERAALRAFRSRARPVFTVRSTAVLPDGSSFTREAVVDLTDPAAPVVLAWKRTGAPGSTFAVAPE